MPRQDSWIFFRVIGSGPCAAMDIYMKNEMTGNAMAAMIQAMVCPYFSLLQHILAPISGTNENKRLFTQ